MPPTRFKSAYLMIDRAAKHIADLNDIIRKNPPFIYTLETDTQTGERSTFAKNNEAVIDNIGVISREVINHLRTALDHAYWGIVSPLVTDTRKHKAIQFPFSESPDGLDGAIKQRFAHLVGSNFVEAIKRFKPHGEPGGNKLLYIIHYIDKIGKHRSLAPIGDYTRISSEIIKRQVPDFPSGLVNIGFGRNYRDVGWNSSNIDRADLVKIVPPFLHIFHKELDVPVQVVFVIREASYEGPVIPTLNQMVDVVKEVISVLDRAS